MSINLLRDNGGRVYATYTDIPGRWDIELFDIVTMLNSLRVIPLGKQQAIMSSRRRYES